MNVHSQESLMSSLVLVTGATSGIGRATALRLARAGHRVFATGRRVAALEELAREARLEVLPLDVTDPASISSVQAEIDRRTDGYGVDVLVNNAGYGAVSPLEEMSDAALRAQFETNVFGLMAVTRAFLPAMRRRGRGRVVNVSSVGGRVTFPLLGAYNATKYAVESLSDALRMELAPFGVQVVLIEPGSIATEFGQVAVGTVSVSEGSPYARALAAAQETNERFARRAAGPDTVAQAIELAITARRPRARYVTPWDTYVLLLLSRLLPTSWFDALQSRVMGLTPEPRAAITT
jgi:NAD(P)-dependent dehydrogenase (short-subunit alcohol dehydrogenase family)